MKVAIVHDDLVQWGGAERVLLAISEIFPEAPIYTSVFDSSNKTLPQLFGQKRMVTSFMQKIPGWKRMYKILLPLYPIAFEQFDFSDYDLVISHTTRFAKSVITKPQTLHICYCHTPPRFLWNFSGEKVSKLLSPYLSFLKVYDQISARRVDYWIAGSKNCQRRIKSVYKKDSEVVLPFVDDKFFQSEESFDGGYYLLISRLNKYKRVDIVVECFNELGLDLKIVGSGSQKNKLFTLAKGNIEFLEGVSDELLVNLIAGCKALIVAAEEDFGMTLLEAQAMGKPVIAYKKGGALETVIDGKTGVFFEDQSSESLRLAVLKFEGLYLKSKDCKEQALGFTKDRFKEGFKRMVTKLSEFPV